MHRTSHVRTHLVRTRRAPGRAPRRTLAVFAAASLLGLGALGTPPSGASAPPQGATVFLVQGVAGSTWDLGLDGEVREDVAGKEIVGPLEVRPGTHRVEATAADGTTVEATVRVGAGDSVDVVLHLPVDASATPVLTTFGNDLRPVRDGSSRLAIAHTAAVGPADIKVDGRVLFADVASGEELTVTVPADTYRVAVVPAATDDPPVLGPVDLPVPAGNSVRVFAIGVAATGSMDAVVHEMPVPVRGSATAPQDVPGGTGGQHDPGAPLRPAALAGVGVGALLTALLVVLLGGDRRRATPPRSRA